MSVHGFSLFCCGRFMLQIMIYSFLWGSGDCLALELVNMTGFSWVYLLQRLINTVEI